MFVHRACVIATALLMPAPLIAQTIHGSVVDRSQRPVVGVVVLLLDNAGTVSARALTNERGEYRLSASAAGVFRVRTLRIGFRAMTSDPIALGNGMEVSQRLSVTDVAPSLDTIRVRGRNVCQVRPDSAVATFAIWEQVRTALMATQLTEATESITTRIVSYRRSVDPQKGHVQRQTSAVSSGRSTGPWSSLSADSLRRAGYVVTGLDGAINFHAPDLGVLLSDVFVEDHCVRIAPESDRARVGIAFEPTRDRRRVPEIRGTVWVDRKSSELRRLEFSYVNVARELESAGAGGDMDFARMTDGSWVISRWNIRMPVIQSQRIAGRGTESRGFETWVSEVRVNGGELVMVSRGRDTLWARPPLTLAGRVIDARGGAGVGAAWLTLDGTRLGGTSDTAGHFRIPDVLPGGYTVNVRTPSLDSVGAQHSVQFNFADSAATLTVEVPTAAQVVPALCGATLPASASGIATGTITRSRDSLPPYNVKVIAEWAEQSQAGPATARQSRWLEARTDAYGKFRLCGLPVNTVMMLRAEDDSTNVARAELRIPATQRFVFAHLQLEKPVVRGAVLTGATLSDFNAQPIPDVEVALTGLSKNAFSNDRGAFRLNDIPAGTHDVVVRRLGYRQVALSIAFGPGQIVERQIMLSRIVTLDTVAVKASPRDQMMREFEDNRRLGLGKFWTRAELEKLDGHYMSSILSQLQGSRVLRGSGTYAWIARSRGVLSLGGTDAGAISPDLFDANRGAPMACYADVWVDNVRVYSGKHEQPLFNLNSIAPHQIEAMEYYAGPAQTPARYMNLNTACGVLVIWTLR